MGILGMLRKGPETLVGMGIQKWGMNQQIAGAKELQDSQAEHNKELAEFSQQLALDTWDKTNYAAQGKQMEKAGLNKGLMYGMSGGGGATVGGANAGSVGGGMPSGGDGLGLLINSSLKQEEIENQKKIADSTAELNKAQADKLKGVDTQETQWKIFKTGAEIEKLIAETKNVTLSNAGAEYENELKRINADLGSASMEDVLKALTANRKKLEAEAKVAGATAPELIKQARQNTIEQQLRMSMIKTEIIKKGAETEEIKKSIEKMAAEINNMSVEQRQNWGKLGQEQQKLWLQERGVDFSTSTPAQIGQWTKVVSDIIRSVEDATK